MKQIIPVISAMVLSACGLFSTPEPTLTPEQSAWNACRSFVERKTDIPILDAQSYSPARVITLENNKFRVEVFYPDHNQTYKCELLRKENGDFDLQVLEVR